MPAFGPLEIFLMVVFFILMVIGTGLDRRYNEIPKR